MILKYLQVVLRVMLKFRGYTFINIIGLTIGITCSLLMGLYVADELRYDAFHPNNSSIYRIVTSMKDEGLLVNTALSPAPLISQLDNRNAVEEATRMAVWKTFPIRYQDKSFTEDYLLLADSNFFSFFSFQLVAGNPNQVLQGEHQLVITESAAVRYFNYSPGADSLVLGKKLILAQGYEATISGIAKNPPAHSHFHFTHILSLASWTEIRESPWILPRIYTYLRLSDNASIESTQKNLNQFIQARHREALTHDSTNIQLPSSISLELQPLNKIHLQSALADEIEKNGNINNVYTLTTIAFFVAILACINFINLSTARSVNRSKEVAVRKTVGASSVRLMRQFFVESYFYIILSLLLSYGLVATLLPFFNFYTGKSIAYSYLTSPQVILILLLLVIIIGFLAGFYPAIYLASYNPIEVLHGNLRAQRRGFGVRNILVVFQFFIASVMIISTLVVYSQLQFMNNLDLGFKQDHVLNLLHTKNLLDKGNEFKQELKKIDEVENASYCNRLPPNLTWDARFTADLGKIDLRMYVYEMDHDHIETMNLQMKDGHFFKEDLEEDSTAMIINETARKRLGWKDLNDKYLYSYYDLPNGKLRKVIGVIKDFNFQSAKEPIKPLAIILAGIPNWEMAIRVKGENLDSIQSTIQKVWNKYTENAPFEVSLLDQNVKGAYATEKNVGILFLVFSVFAIFIACLGLFGLASATIQKRNKEIGIRKALGATTSLITYLLNKQFLWLVLLGNIIAWPLAWLLLNNWLKQFEYKISLNLHHFLLTTVITSIVAILAVSHHAIRAARSNPVNSLRSE